MPGKKANVISEISLNIPEIALGKSNLSFKIKQDKAVLGTLEISRGSIKWFAKNAKTPTSKKNWIQFAAMMESEK